MNNNLESHCQELNRLRVWAYQRQLRSNGIECLSCEAANFLLSWTGKMHAVFLPPHLQQHGYHWEDRGWHPGVWPTLMCAVYRAVATHKPWGCALASARRQAVVAVCKALHVGFFRRRPGGREGEGLGRRWLGRPTTHGSVTHVIGYPFVGDYSCAIYFNIILEKK